MLDVSLFQIRNKHWKHAVAYENLTAETQRKA